MFHRSLPKLQAGAGHGIRPLPVSASSSDWSERALQRTWRSVGRLCVLIGVVNAFIPVMPTTVFLLMGLWAYSKGDPALCERLLQHPRFGNALRLWVEHRQITRRGKVAALIGMGASGAITTWALGDRPLSWGIAASLVALGVYLGTREEPKAEPTC